MVSQLAKEDIEALIDEGCKVGVSDIIRLNALALKIEKRPDFRLATLPRAALCGGVLFQQPTIGQDIFLDQLKQIFAANPATVLALEAYVLAHPEKDWNTLPRFPRLFAFRCVRWIKKHLRRENADKVKACIDYVKYGCNPLDGEWPVYMADETWEKWYGEQGPLSGAMRQYMQACTLGIASDSALRATSPQLAAMIERGYVLHDTQIGDEEKRATAEYFATLDEIKKRCCAERDAKKAEVK